MRLLSCCLPLYAPPSSPQVTREVYEELLSPLGLGMMCNKP